MGGDNLYQFALNTQKWIDSLELSKCDPCGKDKDKLPGGTTVKDFKASLVKLPPGERVAKIKSMAEQVASSRSWTRAKNIERLNPKRTIYTDGTNFYSLDTQHGRFEKLNKKGKHMGEAESNNFAGIDRQWVIDNWNKWIYETCNVDDVYVIQNYPIPVIDYSKP